jgi:hypothetical protein
MVLNLAVPNMESPSAALRYGLLTIKPIAVEEIVKLKGRKYVKKGICFQQDIENKTELEKFENFINFRFAQIFERMPIPSQFNQERIINSFIDNAIDIAKNDKDFMEHLERKERSLFRYVNFITDMFEKNMPSFFEAEADRFLKSNLPLTFSAQSSMFINTYYKYLLLVKRVVRRFEILTNMPGIRNKFKQTSVELASMQKELAPIIDKMDLCCIEYMKLNLYMDIWSSENIDEIHNVKFIDMTKFEEAYFKEFSVAYDIELKNTRRMLFEVSKKFEPELFDIKPAPENSTSVMLSKLLSSV